MIANSVFQNGLIISWEEYDEKFQVLRDALGKPLVVTASRGKWGTQQLEFIYRDGEFLGLNGLLKSSMLQVLLEEAKGILPMVTMTYNEMLAYTPRQNELVEISDRVGNPIHRWDGSRWTLFSGRGWKDLIGDVVPKTQGAGSPTLTTIAGQRRWFAYAAGNDGDIFFHMPHDWAPATDLFLHVHWLHNGTNISGTFDMACYASFGKGFGQNNPHNTEITKNITVNSLSLANTPALDTRVDEIQLSAPGGAGGLLDTDGLEVDGGILVHYDMVTIPTITGGAAKPFIMAIDIHYYSDRYSTPGKAPSFY